MGKIITFYNHKGGVGKTTLVHNIGFALADLGKKVLMIDADPQMNLTSAMYGLSTAVEYSLFEEATTWAEHSEKYISLTDYLNDCLRGITVTKKIFHRDDSYIIGHRKSAMKGGCVDLISGSITLSVMEADLYNVITTINEFTRDIPYKFEQSIRVKAKEYDFVLIDTSPSASSIINGLIVMSSDYYIAPVTPTFFSLQAIDNLGQVINNWDNLLRPYKTTIAQKGISANPKFLGLVVQLAKRYKANKLDTGYSKAAENWIGEVNQSVKRFVDYIGRDSCISEKEFYKLFDGREPYIIEKCCDYMSNLRNASEKEGVPVIYLTDAMCRKHKVNVFEENKGHYDAFNSVKQSYMSIAESLTKLL
jgi:chromosome partitioning protein